MPKLIELDQHNDSRGNLVVIEDFNIGFLPKRIFYIYGKPQTIRGRHRHHKTVHACVCIQGSCTFYTNDGKEAKTFILDSPDKCLTLNPEDWHAMYNFSFDSILLVLSSENFSTEDYIFEPYDGDTFSRFE